MGPGADTRPDHLVIKPEFRGPCAADPFLLVEDQWTISTIMNLRANTMGFSVDRTALALGRDHKVNRTCPFCDQGAHNTADHALSVHLSRSQSTEGGSPARDNVILDGEPAVAMTRTKASVHPSHTKVL